MNAGDHAKSRVRREIKARRQGMIRLKTSLRERDRRSEKGGDGTKSHGLSAGRDDREKMLQTTSV